MENQKRHLELAVVKVEGEQVTFRIADQTHREDEFCETGDFFKAKNGIEIYSLCNPIVGGKYILYVRGSSSIGDFDELTTTIHQFARIMEAITEYNETNGKGYEKPWPQEGDKYFCFNSAGQINDYTYDKLKIDEPRREFGNFFRTREEAEAALERVKKALKGE